MCYTPIIAISTAFIEFFLALTIIFVFRRSYFRNMFALFIFLLGAYQMTEFMLCTSQQPEFWALLGFLAYNFLPAIALYETLRFTGKKVNPLLIYSPPTIFALVALTTQFIKEATCNEPFVTVRHIFYQTGQTVLPWIYATYYFGFIIAACVIAFQAYKKERNKIRREINLLKVIGVVLMSVPTFILVVLFPILSIKFPSIYCHFALLLAIMTFIAAYLESKLPIKK
ncbi:MAG: hypothetical protein HY363_04850 [Candidatus Aenigmarchaeota archaeon]|nr:hypothetical protein [Candidatus Aenigmarchaeota archaeon]